MPRVWEKIKAGLEAGIAAEPDPARKQAVQWAIDTGLQRVQAEQAASSPRRSCSPSTPAPMSWCWPSCASGWGSTRRRCSTPAPRPTPIDVLEFFHAIGLPICELWGMSELTAVGTCNPPERPEDRHGRAAAARAWRSRIAEDGELLCRGPIMMRGYRSDPEQTAEAIDADGWLHTGDIAEIDSEGYVKIVDRKKELIINAAGKNMSPANIEAQIKGASPLIGQAVAIGDRRPYNVALIVLDPDGAQRMGSRHTGSRTPRPRRCCEAPEIGRRLRAAIERGQQPSQPRGADQAASRSSPATGSPAATS